MGNVIVVPYQQNQRMSTPQSSLTSRLSSSINWVHPVPEIAVLEFNGLISPRNAVYWHTYSDFMVSGSSLPCSSIRSTSSTSTDCFWPTQQRPTLSCYCIAIFGQYIFITYSSLYTPFSSVFYCPDTSETWQTSRVQGQPHLLDTPQKNKKASISRHAHAILLYPFSSPSR